MSDTIVTVQPQIQTLETSQREILIVDNTQVEIVNLGGGAVTSVFGRTGDVIAQTGDYDFSQVAGLLDVSTQVTGDLDFSNLAQIAGLAVLGVGGNSPADVGPIIASTDNQVLRRSGTSLAFGTVAAAGIANNAINDVKLRDSAALSVIGRSANSTGDPADIAAASDGQVLRRSSSTLGFGAIDLASTNAVTGILPPANTTAINIQTFSSSGTWNKPSGAKEVTVLCVGAGGGGGSGRRHSTTVNRCGGGGGSAGRISLFTYNAGQLGATETVTVGAGGAGAAAVTSDSTSGSAGSAGGDTFFGGTTSSNSKQMATGGAGGPQGSANPNPTPAGSSEFTLTQQFYPANGAGTNNMTGLGGTRASVGPASGGGGGGLDTSNTQYVGGDGGSARNAFFSGVNTGGPAGGSAGGTNGAAGTAGDAFTTSPFIFGAGGAGGGSASAATAGSGGVGGNPGAGGGGGGASSNGFNSGAGGNGADGMVIVITRF